jgi:amidase
MIPPPVVDAFVQRKVFTPLAAGPLSGTTFAVKDLFDVAGERTGCGNPTWARTHPPAIVHAAAVERLLLSGARLLGKVRTDEMAYSLDGNNAHEGAPLNPAAPDRLTGGSSSGSASAVAAREVDFAIGTDTAGSVRVPAAWCGLYGIRPTHGAVATRGLTPLAPSFDVVGWFARDSALLRRVGEVLLPGDAGASPAGAPADIRRCTLVRDPCAEDGVDLEVAAAVKAVFAAGAVHVRDAREAQLPVALQEVADCLRVLQAAEAWHTHAAWIEAERPGFGPAVAERFAMARAITAAEVEAAQGLRARLVGLVDEALPHDRILVLPAVPGPALSRQATPEQLQARRSRIFPLTALASLTGRPQVTVPCRTATGLPIGVGLLGWRGGDRALVALAGLLQ